MALQKCCVPPGLVSVGHISKDDRNCDIQGVGWPKWWDFMAKNLHWGPNKWISAENRIFEPYLGFRATSPSPPIEDLTFMFCTRSKSKVKKNRLAFFGNQENQITITELKDVSISSTKTGYEMINNLLFFGPRQFVKTILHWLCRLESFGSFLHRDPPSCC